MDRLFTTSEITGAYRAHKLELVTFIVHCASDSELNLTKVSHNLTVRDSSSNVTSQFTTRQARVGDRPRSKQALELLSHLDHPEQGVPVQGVTTSESNFNDTVTALTH